MSSNTATQVYHIHEKGIDHRQSRHLATRTESQIDIDSLRVDAMLNNSTGARKAAVLNVRAQSLDRLARAEQVYDLSENTDNRVSPLVNGVKGISVPNVTKIVADKDQPTKLKDREMHHNIIQSSAKVKSGIKSKSSIRVVQRLVNKAHHSTKSSRGYDFQSAILTSVSETNATTVAYTLAINGKRTTYTFPIAHKAVASFHKQYRTFSQGLADRNIARKYDKKYIILAVVDLGYLDMAINLYLTSFLPLRLTHFLFVCAERTACEVLNALGIAAYPYLHYGQYVNITYTLSTYKYKCTRMYNT